MGDNWKPEPISSTSLIRVGGTNFANINSVQELRSMQAGAGHHRVFERSQGIVAFDDNNVGRSAQVRIPSNSVSVKSLSLVGRRAIDKTNGKKVTIIQAAAGYTKKTKTPVHRVASRSGRTWLAKATDLELQ